MSERTIESRVDELERGFARVLEAMPDAAEGVSEQLRALWQVQAFITGALLLLGLALIGRLLGKLI